MKVLSGYLDVSTNKVGGLVLTSWGTGLYPTRWSQHPSIPALSASYAFSHDWGAETGGQASPHTACLEAALAVVTLHLELQTNHQRSFHNLGPLPG